MKSKNHHIEEGNKERTARVQSEETEPSIDRIMKDLLTVEEVARRLKISKATVRRHIKAYKGGKTQGGKDRQSRPDLP